MSAGKSLFFRFRQCRSSFQVWGIARPDHGSKSGRAGGCGLSRRLTIQGEDLTVAFAMEEGTGFEPAAVACAERRSSA